MPSFTRSYNKCKYTFNSSANYTCVNVAAAGGHQAYIDINGRIGVKDLSNNDIGQGYSNFRIILPTGSITNLSAFPHTVVNVSDVLLYTHGYRFSYVITGLNNSMNYNSQVLPEPWSSTSSEPLSAYIDYVLTTYTNDIAFMGVSFSIQGFNSQHIPGLNYMLLEIYKRIMQPTQSYHHFLSNSEDPRVYKVLSWGSSLGGFVNLVMNQKKPELLDSMLLEDLTVTPWSIFQAAGDLSYLLKLFFDNSIQVGYVYGYPYPNDIGTQVFVNVYRIYFILTALTTGNNHTARTGPLYQMSAFRTTYNYLLSTLGIGLTSTMTDYTSNLIKSISGKSTINDADADAYPYPLLFMLLIGKITRFPDKSLNYDGISAPPLVTDLIGTILYPYDPPPGVDATPSVDLRSALLCVKKAYAIIDAALLPGLLTGTLFADIEVSLGGKFYDNTNQYYFRSRLGEVRTYIRDLFNDISDTNVRNTYIFFLNKTFARMNPNNGFSTLKLDNQTKNTADAGIIEKFYKRTSDTFIDLNSNIINVPTIVLQQIYDDVAIIGNTSKLYTDVVDNNTSNKLKILLDVPAGTGPIPLRTYNCITQNGLRHIQHNTETNKYVLALLNYSANHNDNNWSTNIETQISSLKSSYPSLPTNGIVLYKTNYANGTDEKSACDIVQEFSRVLRRKY